VKSARLLATGQKLKFIRTGDDVAVQIPAIAPDAISSTIVLKITGTPQVVTPAKH
jgi:hypothetical protein